jgi:hypothetical protein
VTKLFIDTAYIDVGYSTDAETERLVKLFKKVLKTTM